LFDQQRPRSDWISKSRHKAKNLFPRQEEVLDFARSARAPLPFGGAHANQHPTVVCGDGGGAGERGWCSFAEGSVAGVGGRCQTVAGWLVTRSRGHAVGSAA